MIVGNPRGKVPGVFQRMRQSLANGIGLFEWGYNEHRLPNVGTGNLSPSHFSTFAQGYGGVAVDKAFRSINNGKPQDPAGVVVVMGLPESPQTFVLKPLITGKK